ncbi:uncharacterized protein A1O5_03588 [Cladophialophora psammophila CBS 110553]|uniref:Amino acid permease n=1 Tax=Cladophialophora psammophila CBS 110553 TaxID=1182543 RepID=W9XA75_9EURO|nr:uncharacterized protein A1O5_03588 [Cladophialophora psammophila CBS 110553]EXJ73826.1 hypothetical protein A1O5_03588 [Cladophialophora psammophila CBS 110553]
MDKALKTHETQVYPDGVPGGQGFVGEKDGTMDDVKDMQRMGKEQQFRRNFGFLSIMGFAMILMSTWESQLGTAGFALGNGGTAGIVYMYIACAIGMSLNIVSMAEMASMAPTAGGQYHWVSEFAPPRAQKFISYFIGWVCVLGWQAGAASSVFLAATEIQGLIVLNYDSYVYKYWHGTLLTIAITLVCGFFNTVLAKRLPLVEGLVLFLHIAGFFGILVPLWVLAPRTPSKQVWTAFEDANGWGNVGLACLVGMNSPVLSLLGADAATHMSEELKNASKILPRAMVFTAIFNGTLGFIMVITFCYTVGNVEQVLSTPTGYPFIQVFYNATQSRAGATTMVSIMIALSTFGAMTNMATGSRQIFAFARDRGVPFSNWVAYVPKGWDIPLNGVIFTVVVSCLLSLINIGSQIAFNQLTSLGLCALLSSYIVSISCMAIKRIRKEPLLPSKFSLGRYGLAINLLSVGFLLLAFIMIFFPPGPNPNPQTMNWAIVVYGGVVFSSLTYYVFRGRFRYAGPVEYVRKTI